MSMVSYTAPQPLIVVQVKVMLKVAGKVEDSLSLKVDRRHKQVTLTDPGAAPQGSRVGVAAPKMFAFDAIFTEEDNQVRQVFY